MIGASALSGDTLIACSFPVVPLPTWQLPVQALCSSAKRPSRLFSVGLTRAVSLPEQDSLHREQAFAGGRRQFSSSYGSLNEDRGEEEGGSDSSGRYDSTSSPEESSSQPKEKPEARGSARSHNSFLPTSEMDDEEEDDDSEGGNLHRYREDSAFVLQGNSNWPLSSRMVAENFQLSQEQMGGEWTSEGTLLGAGGEQPWLSNQPKHPYQSHGTRLAAPRSCCAQGQHRGSPESFPRSDSSCNSSDGVLVNFCTIYSGSNNPATPRDPISPELQPPGSSEGSVVLSLRPVGSPRREDRSPSAPCWAPQGLDSNCNLCSREALPQGLSSLELSDLTACLQSQASWATGTNQKYYKLVTCDLLSQSPSPAWSSNTSCPEGPNKSSPCLPAQNLPVDLTEGQAEDLEVTRRRVCVSTCTRECVKPEPVRLCLHLTPGGRTAKAEALLLCRVRMFPEQRSPGRRRRHHSESAPQAEAHRQPPELLWHTLFAVHGPAEPAERPKPGPRGCVRAAGACGCCCSRG